MIKLNRSGFMMAEVIVVSAVVLGVLISTYTSYSKIFTRYSEVLNYYNIDGVYRLAEIRDSLINSNEIDGYFGSSYSKYDTQVEGETVYFIQKDYLTSNNISSLNDFNVTFKDYLNYLVDSVSYRNGDANYIMVIEWPKSDDSYYYNYLELEA